jgi:tetratricopeptide (TPR) repeat protein
MAAFQRRAFPECVSLCRSVLAAEPSDVGTLNLLGQALLALQKPTDAAEAFTRAVQVEPSLGNLHFNLALARQAEGRLADAIVSVRRAMTLDPSVPVLPAKLGQLLLASGDSFQAAEVLRRALSMDPASIPVHLNLAQALTDLGELDEAERLTRAALFLNPRDATAHRMLGRVHQLRGKFSDAVTAFEAAIARDPTQAAAHFALAYSLPFREENRPILARIETLLSREDLPDADRTLLAYAAGKAFDDLGEYETAFPHFVTANTLALKSAGRRFDPELETLKVDRLIEIFASENQLGETDQTDRPIFIVGMIRSGTTLVEQVLSRHPDIAPGGELAFWSERQPRLIFDYVAARETGVDFTETRLDYDAELNRISPHARHVTDKMPLNYSSLGLIRAAYPAARIIHCRRDPRDTALSIYLTPYRRGPDFAHDLDNIAVAYQQYDRLMAHWRRVIPASNFFEVDYEHLVTEPEATTRAMIVFLGLDWNEACLDPAANDRPVNTPSQWQVRQPVYRQSVGRWRNYESYLAKWL